MTEFFSKENTLVDVKEMLYNRLEDVRRALAIKVDPEDQFDLGINCRAANEEYWLVELLDRIERS